MIHFKIGDYAVHETLNGVVFHITNDRDKQVVNAQNNFRKATEDEIKEYRKEAEVDWEALI